MKISIITTTFNSECTIKRLVECLMAQTDSDFEWIVADGGSTDNTVKIIKSINNLKTQIIEGPDFGIYDGINRALLICRSEFYLVVGSDDILKKNTIALYKEYATSEVDIVTANVLRGKMLHTAKKRKISFLDDTWSYVSCHSVGCLIRRSLHDEYGLYSKRFPIAADQYFLNKIIKEKKEIKKASFLAGEFNEGGVSSTDVAGHLCETFRVNYETGNYKFIQLILFLLRLVKNKFQGKF